MSHRGTIASGCAATTAPMTIGVVASAVTTGAPSRLKASTAIAPGRAAWIMDSTSWAGVDSTTPVLSGGASSGSSVTTITATPRLSHSRTTSARSSMCSVSRFDAATSSMAEGCANS